MATLPQGLSDLDAAEASGQYDFKHLTVAGRPARELTRKGTAFTTLSIALADGRVAIVSVANLPESALLSAAAGLGN